MSPQDRNQANPKPTYGGGGAPDCSKTVTIRITANGLTNHNQAVKRGNCVQWRDQTGVARTLKFQSWPFTQAWQDIVVPAGGYSNVFQIAAGAPSASYPYVPDPYLPVGPPDPPTVVVGD
jgi:hypothetical protein